MRFLGKKKIDWESEGYKRARYHYLLQIIYGESLAFNHCLMMSAFAPTKEARDFLLKQQMEEDTHLELLTNVVSKMDRPNEHISSQMTKLHKIMELSLEKKDYPACILIQNFIVEGLAVTLCEQQGEYGDDTIHKVFKIITKDELGHVAFGVRELKKILETDTNGLIQKRLIGIQRKVLYHSVMLFRDLALDAGKLGMEWDVLAEKVILDHIVRIKQAGFHLPLLDRIFLKVAVAFFRAV